jgi:hypothetical protein
MLFQGTFPIPLERQFLNLRKAQDTACQLEDSLKFCEPDDFSQIISLQDEITDLALTHDILINNIDIMEEEEPPTKQLDMDDMEDLPCKIPIKWSTRFSNTKDVDMHP